jgi:hypothetical protein
LSSEGNEISTNAWQDVVAFERGQRAMAAALTLRSKGYPRVHVGGGRVVGPGALAWFSGLRWANEELLVDIGLNAARHPDITRSCRGSFLIRGQQSFDQPQALTKWTIPKSAYHTQASA